MELVYYFRGWVEVASKQTDRTDGGWLQSIFGAKHEQIGQQVAIGCKKNLFQYLNPECKCKEYQFWSPKIAAASRGNISPVGREE